MSSSIGRHLRANVIGYLALFLALTGITYAAGLPKNSVKSKQIKDGAVRRLSLATARSRPTSSPMLPSTAPSWLTVPLTPPT